MREIERYLVLQVVDARWREHLDSMEYLREGIHLRAMAQKDPLSEYRAEGHTLFQELTAIIREEVLRFLFHVEIEREEAQQLVPAAANGGTGAKGSSTSTSRSPAPTRSRRPAPARASPRPLRAHSRESPPARPSRRSASPRRRTRSAATTRAGAARGKKYKKCHGS